jgi:hypothetical protein
MSDLFIYDSGCGDFSPWLVDELATKKFKIDKQSGSVQPAGSWKAVAAKIISKTSIDRLILLAHGAAGSATFGSDRFDVGDHEVLDLFAPTSGKKPPPVKEIIFLGCEVGLWPAKMAAFGKLFGAKAVSGYTWEMVVSALTLNFPKGTDESEIEKALKPLREYAYYDLPAAKDLAKLTKVKSQVLQFVAAYGSDDGSLATGMPIPFGEQNSRLPWTGAEEKPMTAKEADQLGGDMVLAPVKPFEYITVAP